MRELAAQNQVFTSLIGQGYSGTILPAVIQRNILENPAWYTAYTPYQPEISQGRLEALFNFQTMICDLTGLDVANASLLDEGTAAAEAMALARARRAGEDQDRSSSMRDVHPQTLAVLRTRAEPLGWTLIVGDPLADLDKRRGVRRAAAISGHIGRGARSAAGDRGAARQGRAGGRRRRSAGADADRSPGELGADIAIGSAQRFGVPMGYGGPHAAYMAVRDALKRSLPGRLVGLSVDSRGAAGLSAGAADARAAYPPRKGDLQHLHRAGAAGGDRLDVRGLSRPRRADAYRAHASIAAPRCWRRGWQSSALRRRRRRSSIRSRSRPAASRTRSSPARWPRRSICGSATARSASRRRDHHAGNRRGGVARLRRQAVLCRGRA